MVSMLSAVSFPTYLISQDASTRLGRQCMKTAGCYVIEHWCATVLSEVGSRWEMSFNSETNRPVREAGAHAWRNFSL